MMGSDTVELISHDGGSPLVKKVAIGTQGEIVTIRRLKKDDEMKALVKFRGHRCPLACTRSQLKLIKRSPDNWIDPRYKGEVTEDGFSPRYIANLERLSFYLVSVTDRETE